MSAAASPPWPPCGASSPKNGQLSPHRLATLTAALLLLDDARIDGLLDTGAWVDRARCHRVLSNLKRDGVMASEEEVESVAVELMAELGAVRG